jgi:hypothetical protein
LAARSRRRVSALQRRWRAAVAFVQRRVRVRLKRWRPAVRVGAASGVGFIPSARGDRRGARCSDRGAPRSSGGAVTGHRRSGDRGASRRSGSGGVRCSSGGSRGARRRSGSGGSLSGRGGRGASRGSRTPAHRLGQWRGAALVVGQRRVARSLLARVLGGVVEAAEKYTELRLITTQVVYGSVSAFLSERKTS